MCVDANAGARNAARQRWMEKDAKYRSESLKFWNRETSAVRGMQRAATGYSRAISNDYQRALYVQGQARKAYQAGFIKYQKCCMQLAAYDIAVQHTIGIKPDIHMIIVATVERPPIANAPVANAPKLLLSGCCW